MASTRRLKIISHKSALLAWASKLPLRQSRTLKKRRQHRTWQSRISEDMPSSGTAALRCSDLWTYHKVRGSKCRATNIKPCNNSSRIKIHTRFYSKVNSVLQLLVRHRRKDSLTSLKVAFSNSPNNSRLNLDLIPFRLQEEDSTLPRLHNSILLQIDLLEVDYSQIQLQAIQLVKVDLVLWALNLRISLNHHSSVQAEIKIPSSQHSSLVVYSNNHSSSNKLKVVVEASFSSLSSLDSKIQLSLEALVGCSISLLVVRLTLRHRYSALNLVLQGQPLEDSSLNLEPQQQVQVELQVSSHRHLNQQVLLEGYFNNLQPHLKVQVSSDQDQEQARAASSLSPELNQLVAAYSRLRPAHSSRLKAGYSNNLNRLSNQECSTKLRHKVSSRLQDRCLELVIKLLKVDSHRLLI